MPGVSSMRTAKATSTWRWAKGAQVLQFLQHFKVLIPPNSTHTQLEVCFNRWGFRSSALQIGRPITNSPVNNFWLPFLRCACPSTAGARSKSRDAR